MAISTCPKCDSTIFETKEGAVRGSNFKLTFVQCASCGAVVGVLDFFNIGQLVQDLAVRLTGKPL
jgi:RNase P subunit RPR2